MLFSMFQTYFLRTLIHRAVHNFNDIDLIAFTKTCLFKYIEIFTTKNREFSDKNSDIFHISAQNIDCGYSLEPPREAVLTSTYNLCF